MTIRLPPGLTPARWLDVPAAAWIAARAFTTARSAPSARALLGYPLWLGLCAAYRRRGWLVRHDQAVALLRPSVASEDRLLIEASAFIGGSWGLLALLWWASSGRLPGLVRAMWAALVDGWLVAAVVAETPWRRRAAVRDVERAVPVSTWWVDVLAAWPTGHGAGGTLLADVLGAAQHEGREVALVSVDPRNRSLYDRHLARRATVPLDPGSHGTGTRDAVLYRS